MEGVQQMFGPKYLSAYWKRRSNVDVASLFVVLMLMVGELKEVVFLVVSTCVNR